MKLPVSEHVLQTNLTGGYEVKIEEEDHAAVLTLLRENITDTPMPYLVKETLSNSIDIHKDFGVTRPVEITLPSTFSNDLVFRDFGSGLDKEFMTTKYTRAGYSTKKNTNLQMGGYGLGRLSPLAYTDSYSIYSYLNGVKYSYLISVYDFEGVKKMEIFPFGEEPTSEPNGLAISIPVKSKDVRDFENIVREHCLYLYDCPPLINGEPAKTLTKDIESKDGVWYTTIGEKGDNNITYLIGGMPNEGTVRKFSSLSNHDDYLGKLNLVVNVPIGSVSQTASKDIQKTEYTEGTITKILEQVKSELINLLEKKVKGCETYLEAYQLLSSDFGEYPGELRTNVKWNDLTLKNIINIYKLGITCFKIESGQRYSNRHKLYKRYQDVIYSRNQVYINDLKYKLTTELLEKYIPNLTSTYIISATTDPEKIEPYKFKLLSSIMPEKVENLKPRAPKKKVLSTEMSAWSLRQDPSLMLTTGGNTVRVPKEPDEEMYYLITDGKTLAGNDNGQRLYCELVGYDSIYLFNDSSKINHPNWINYEEHLKSKVLELESKYPGIIEYYQVENTPTFSVFLDEYSRRIKNPEVSNFVSRFSAFSGTPNNKERLFLRTYVKLYLKNKLNDLQLEATNMKNKFPALFGKLTIDQVETYIQQVNFYSAHVN